MGAQSAASYRLATAAAGAGRSPNTYGVQPDAFSDEAQEIGLILAAHASVAATAAVRERGAHAGSGTEPDQGPLLSRDVIGQANGIPHETAPPGCCPRRPRPPKVRVTRREALVTADLDELKVRLAADRLVATTGKGDYSRSVMIR